jgi:hypothetical protein
VNLGGGVHRLQHDFNQSFESVRVLVVLSPTCPNCLEGYEMLSRMPPGPKCLVLRRCSKGTLPLSPPNGAVPTTAVPTTGRRKTGPSLRGFVRFLVSVHTFPK